MKDKDVLHFFSQSLNECREGMKTLRKVWDVNLDAYMCRKDFSKKKEWQHRVYVPGSKPKTKRAVNLIKKTLLRNEYFDFDTPVRSLNDPIYLQDKLRCNYTKRWVRAHLDAEPCSFIDTFCESLEAAFGWSGLMVIKMWVGYHDRNHIDVVQNEFVKRKQLALYSKAIDPYMFDFTVDRSIQIEHQYVTMPELWDLVEEGLVDEKLVKNLVKCDYSDSRQLKDESKTRLQRLGLDEAKNEYRKEVFLSHFWGPLINKDNKVQKRHTHFIIANEAHLLTEVQENPYPDNSTPYIIGVPIKVPFRHVGKALTEDVNAIESAVCDLVNMQLDNMLWNMLGINEVDPMALSSRTKSDLREVYPGMMVFKNMGYQGNAFLRHEIGADPNRAMPILQELKVLSDLDHGVTDAVNSTLPTLGASAGNEQQQRFDAMSNFEGFATDLERGPFVKCIDKARDLLLQYMSDPMSDPKAQDILGPEGQLLDSLTAEQRKELIVSEYNIVARGISILFERLSKINNYTGLYKILNALPPEAQAWIKWPNVLLDIFSIASLDRTEDKLNTPQEMQQHQQQAQQQQAQAMQMEIQKALAPVQGKIKQTEMGIQERLTALQAKLRNDMQKEVMKLQQKENERKARDAMKTLEIMLKDKGMRQDNIMDLMRIMQDATKQPGGNQ